MSVFFTTLAICLSLLALGFCALLHARIERAVDARRAESQRAALKAARVDIFS